ncbi:MAG: CooT family nickel-binding protein [Desulfobacterales bacterium]|jgi:predicted RNA-binding protein
MCLSTVYVQVKGQRQKVMQDVAKMEFCNEGYLLIGLLGDKKTVDGQITKIDFIDDHLVILESEE